MSISTIISIASIAVDALYLTALYLLWRPVTLKMEALQQAANAALARAEARNIR